MVTVEELDKRLTRVERKVEDWELVGTQTLTELREVQRTNAKMFSVLGESISDLNAKVERGFEQVDRRFEQVDRKFEVLDDGIQTIIDLLKDDDDNGERN